MEQETVQIAGQKFGKYEIVEELGRGAMGVVYKARDPLIGRLVALKTVMPRLLSDPDLLKRFYREAQSAGRLQHPNIVTIHDLGESDGLPYIAMELVEGESLQKVISRRAPLPLAAKLKIVLQICAGLGYAHKHGVVHRDIKPANILVTPNGSVKLVDFGIVHLADTGMTQSGMILGTVSYMSPEQLRGEHVDARSDLFSVGIVMYELLAYRKAFDGPNVTAIMLKVASEQPPPLTEIVPAFPSALDDVVRKCLQKDHEERFPTLEDLAFEIEPFARRLQREVVDAMVEESRDLIARSEFVQAEEVLRSALAMDSSHDAAKGLMSKAQSELRRQKISARVQQCLDDGRRLLVENKYTEATKAFEEVLKLDSQHGQARELLQAASEAAAKASEVRKRIGAAKRALSGGDLTSAEAELRKAQEADAEQSEAASLLERIRQERAAQERRFRLREGIGSARDLIRMERYDDAQAQLQALRSDFPGEAEIGQLLEAIEQKLAERGQVQEAFNQVKALLEQQKFHEAIDRAETVRFQFPTDSETTRLYNFVKTESELAERRQRLEFEVTELQDQVKGQQYVDALAHGERLQREYPGSVEVARLVMLARSEKQAADRLERIEVTRKSIQAMWNAGRLEEASRAAHTALDEFPGDPGLTRILAGLSEEIARQAVPADVTEITTMAATTVLVPPAAAAMAAPSPANREQADRPVQTPVLPTLPVAAGLPVGSAAISPARAPGPAPAEKRSALTPAIAVFLILGLVALGYITLHRRPPERPLGPPAPAAAPSATPQSESSGPTEGPNSGQAPPTANPIPSSSGEAPSSGPESEGATPPTSLAGSSVAASVIKGSETASDETKPRAPKPAAEQPPSALPARGAATGALEVSANVDGARIIIDGNDSGEVTPHTFSTLPAGAHTVSLIKVGYNPTSGAFQVPAGGSASASLQLAQPTGILEFITTPPGAAVSVDGKPCGNTPLKLTLSAGEHTFSVTLGNQPRSGTLTVPADGYIQKQVDFAQ